MIPMLMLITFRQRDLRGLYLLALPDKDTMLIIFRNRDLRGLHALPDKDTMLITVYSGRGISGDSISLLSLIRIQC